MNRKLILRLPPKDKIFIYGQIVFIMIMLWLRDVLGFPSAISYLTDAVTMYLVITNINRIRRGARYAKMKTQSRVVLMMIVCMLIGIVLNLVNPLLVMWGVRNNLRFFAFFYICIGVLDVWDVDSILSLLKKFFWANVLLCSLQYFVQGLNDDHLGGFFGITEGSNGYMNILLCCISSCVLAQYFTGKLRLWKLLVYLVACLYIALLSELKAYYLELAVMTITSVLCVKPTVKTFLLCVLGVALAGLLVYFLAKIDPSSLSLLFDEKAMINYLAGNGYTNSGDLNRSTAIQQLYARFFAGKPIHGLFGFGLGNCEQSQFRFLQSEFYRQYGYLHYRWFTHSWVYIEQGILGLGLLVCFFVTLFIYAYKRRDYERKDLILTAVIFIGVCFVNIIYNCSLQLEICYLMALMVAIPFILTKGTVLTYKATTH